MPGHPIHSRGHYIYKTVDFLFDNQLHWPEHNLVSSICKYITRPFNWVHFVPHKNFTRKLLTNARFWWKEDPRHSYGDSNVSILSKIKTDFSDWGYFCRYSTIVNSLLIFLFYGVFLEKLSPESWIRASDFCIRRQQRINWTKWGFSISYWIWEMKIRCKFPI